VRLLEEAGVCGLALGEQNRHRGVSLRFNGQNHRIDFESLVGASMWLYPQTSVFTDLADACARDGTDVRFGVSNVRILDAESLTPRVAFRAANDAPCEVRCRFLVGADGSHSICRQQIPEAVRKHYSRAYPLAWFGILVESPPSAAELVYTHSSRGFALLSQRTESLQRIYFQCSPDETVAAWSEDRIWAELRARMQGIDDFVLKEGPITAKSLIPMRSFVSEPMAWRRVFLAGDAGHVFPPTGAKGLNVALRDASLLAETLIRAAAKPHSESAQEYSSCALDWAWAAQHFSYWMTSMLHIWPGESEFDIKRQISTLAALTSSSAGCRMFAEGYTGVLSG
jgi:p-hydroxybenzoate 3-monooxygenase